VHRTRRLFGIYSLPPRLESVVYFALSELFPAHETIPDYATPEQESLQDNTSYYASDEEKNDSRIDEVKIAETLIDWQSTLSATRDASYHLDFALRPRGLTSVVRNPIINTHWASPRRNLECYYATLSFAKSLLYALFAQEA